DITDADFPDSTKRVTMYDNYFIVTEEGTRKFWISDLSSGPTTWDSLDFASKGQQGDNLIGHMFDNDTLILFGEFTSERWTNTGSGLFPFEPYPNGYMEKGLAAVH